MHCAEGQHIIGETLKLSQAGERDIDELEGMETS